MATYTPKRFSGPVQLTTSTSTSYYTPATGATGVIKEIILSNPTATPVAASVYLVPTGGTVGNSTTLVPGVTITGNSFITIPMSQVVNNGENIYASAVSGSSITLTISGLEFA